MAETGHLPALGGPTVCRPVIRGAGPGGQNALAGVFAQSERALLGGSELLGYGLMTVDEYAPAKILWFLNAKNA